MFQEIMMLSKARTERIALATILSATVMLGYLLLPQFDILSSHIKYISSSYDRRLELMLQDALRKASTPKVSKSIFASFLLLTSRI